MKIDFGACGYVQLLSCMCILKMVYMPKWAIFAIALSIWLQLCGKPLKCTLFEILSMTVGSLRAKCPSAG